MPTTDRYTRHIRIAHQLRSRSWVSATSLASRFGVSVRTIYRDIEQLIAAGLPIESIAGREGGYRLTTEGSVDSLLVDADDALRLYVMGLAEGLEREIGTRTGTPENSGVSTYARDTLRRLSERIYFDTADWYWKDEGSGHIPEIRQALLTDTAIEISVRVKHASEPKTLVVKPYGIVWKAGDWWLVAAPPRGKIERFRLSYVDRLVRTDLRFSRPEGFNLRQWWSQALEDYGRGPTKVVLQVSTTAREEMLRLRLKPDSEVRHLDDGQILITLYVDKWQWLVPLVASYGADVTVLQPEGLRSALATHHSRALAAYACSTNPVPHRANFRNDDSRLRSTRSRIPLGP